MEKNMIATISDFSLLGQPDPQPAASYFMRIPGWIPFARLNFRHKLIILCTSPTFCVERDSVMIL